MKIAALMVADAAAQSYLCWPAPPPGHADRKVIVLISGGVRRAQTFSETGADNIPHLFHDLLPQALFYAQVRNEGVTGHFNTTSSILTGNWQRVDDWGKMPPASPTIFEYLQKHTGLHKRDVWFVSSNKALTNLVGASSAPGYGPRYGANVVFPKQLLINTVMNVNWQGRRGSIADRNRMQAEIEAMLQGSNYEGLGWTVADEASELDPQVRATVVKAIADLVHENSPVTGDEFTFLVSVEVMRRFAPSLLVISFSDVEVAHFGSYSLHLAGIRTLDRLAHQLWQEIESSPSYKAKTTLMILPEFGRDPDGSNTNGFFNHRSNEDSTRSTWMMCLGGAVGQPQVVERPVRHVDLCPTIASLLDCREPEVLGQRIREIRT
jgi:hypothetical protein